MKPRNSSLRSWLPALSVSLTLASSLAVQAANYDFTGTTNGGWHTNTNWQGGVTPTFNNLADLKFGVNSAMATNASWLGTNNRTVRSLEFGNISAALTINLGSDNSTTTARTLTFDTDSGNSTILVNSTVSANITIGSSAIGSVTLADNLVVTTNNTAGVLSINRAIGETGGAKSLTKEGVGTLSFNTTNTFTGKTTINGGVLRINGDDRLGTAPGAVVADQLTLNGGTLRNFATTTLNANRGITLGVNGGGLSVTNGDLTYAGKITGSGSLAITADVSTRALILDAANDYSGTTTLNSGTLRLGAAGTIASSSNLTINNSGTFNIRNTGNWIYNGTITGDGTGSITPNSGTNATLAGNISGVSSISVNSTSTNATISGNISGANTVTVTGGAILNLSGDNSSMSGIVTLNGATAATQLNLESATALGTGNLIISGGNNGKIDNTNGSALTLSTNNAQTWNSDFTFVGTDDLNLGTGAVTMGGNRSVTVSAKTLTVGGAIGGAFSLIKNGAGTLQLAGANGYTGTTTVSGGTLVITSGGSTDASSAVTLNGSSSLVVNGTINGALVANSSTTVSGSGNIVGDADIRGTHNPGNSPGIQTFGNLAYTGGASVVNWELSANTVTNLANPDAVFDQIVVGGTLDFSGLSSLNLLFNGSGSSVLWADSLWDNSQSWTIYDVAGTTTNFGNLTLNTADWLDSGNNAFSAVRAGSSFSLSKVGEDVILNYNVVPVPEPGSALLGGLGLLAMLRRRRN